MKSSALSGRLSSALQRCAEMFVEMGGMEITQQTLGTHRDQRTAKFVAGIGDELLLTILTRRDPIEHPIHCGPEPGDGIATTRQLNSPARSAAVISSTSARI